MLSGRKKEETRLQPVSREPGGRGERTALPTGSRVRDVRAALGRNADLRSAVSQTSSLRAVRRSPAAEKEPERLGEREAGRPQACDTADRRSALRPRGASTRGDKIPLPLLQALPLGG